MRAGDNEEEQEGENEEERNSESSKKVNLHEAIKVSYLTAIKFNVSSCYIFFAFYYSTPWNEVGRGQRTDR